MRRCKAVFTQLLLLTVHQAKLLPHHSWGGRRASQTSETIVLFVCLGFNGTFSTNRLYHDITVGKYVTKGQETTQIHNKTMKQYTVASEAICKWGAQRRRIAPAKFLLLCPLTFLLCPPPTWGGTTIVCYRLRDNWSGEVGRRAKLIGPTTYSYTHTHRLTAFLVAHYRKAMGALQVKW